MTSFIRYPTIRATVTLTCILLLPFANSPALAQSYPQNFPQAASAAQPNLLTPEQLDDLVAPIALYPDQLLGQMLAASTYPLEIVEAQQWLQQSGNLRGQALIEAAKQQNWDPSVQVLVAFPDAVALFTRDIRWTTELGNAFLAQQADVMNAIQTMRARASDNGRLRNTPQQIVTTERQNDQSAIQIQPANPQVIYPPVYNPAYVWGPPQAGAYPALYPQGGYGYGNGYGYDGGPGYGFGTGINLAGLFTGLLGLVGSGGWGWALGWLTHTLSLNSLFFNVLGLFNFGGGYHSSGGYGGPSFWAHNPAHRLGVPYSNGLVASRYHGTSAAAGFAHVSSASFAHSGFTGSARTASDGWHRPGAGSSAFSPSSSSTSRGFQSGSRPAGSYDHSFASNSAGSARSYRGYSNPMSQGMASSLRSAAPMARNAIPRGYGSTPQHFSTPRVSSPPRSSTHFSAPHFSAPKRSGGGHSGGGHSGKGSHKH